MLELPDITDKLPRRVHSSGESTQNEVKESAHRSTVLARANYSVNSSFSERMRQANEVYTYLRDNDKIRSKSCVPKLERVTQFTRLSITWKSHSEQGPQSGGALSSTPEPQDAVKARLRSLHGVKLKRRLAHPLQDDRAFFEVWPANNKEAVLSALGSRDTVSADSGSFLKDGNFTHPLLFNELDAAIQSKLRKLDADFPQYYTKPSLDNLSPRKWASALSGKTNEKLAPHGKELAVTHESSDPTLEFSEGFRSQEDRYRVERVRIFSYAGKVFAAQFKTYRQLLLCIMSEFDSFLSYCHRNVLSPDDRSQFVEQTIQAAERKFLDEMQSMRNQIEEERKKNVELNNRLKSLEKRSMTRDSLLEEKDRVIAEHNRDLEEAANGRAALLSRIHMLEREIWKQRNNLEGPEKKITELTNTIKEMGEKLTNSATLYEEAMKQRSILQNRIERLEDALRERRRGYGEQGGMIRAELLQHRKREGEMIEQLALLQAKLQRSEQKIKDLTNALDAVRDPETQLTPRPRWADCEEVFESAPSTVKRVEAAADKVRELIEWKGNLALELAELKYMIGGLKRGEAPVESENEIVFSMQLPCFFKMGLETSVPSFLKGHGRVTNMKLSLPTMQGYVRRIWRDRARAKMSVPLDQFMSRFCISCAPEGTAPDVFAYSLFHALHWYGYDMHIGFTKKYVTGRLDERVFQGLVGQGKKLFEKILSEVRPPKASMSPDCEMHRRKGDILDFLRAHLVLKEEEAIRKLLVAINDDTGTQEIIDLRQLFEFSELENRFSHFLEELYKQHLDERNFALKVYTKCIMGLDCDDEAQVSPPVFAEGLWNIDPNIPAQYMDELLSRVFEASNEALFPTVVADGPVKHVGINGTRVYGCGDTIVVDIPSILKELNCAVVQLFSKQQDLNLPE